MCLNRVNPALAIRSSIIVLASSPSGGLAAPIMEHLDWGGQSRATLMFSDHNPSILELCRAV